MTCALDGCDREAGSPVLIKCDGEDPDLQVGVFKIAPCFFNGFSTVSTATFNQVVFDFILEQATLAGESLRPLIHLMGTVLMIQFKVKRILHHFQLLMLLLNGHVIRLTLVEEMVVVVIVGHLIQTVL